MVLSHPPGSPHSQSAPLFSHKLKSFHPRRHKRQLLLQRYTPCSPWNQSFSPQSSSQTALVLNACCRRLVHWLLPQSLLLLPLLHTNHCVHWARTQYQVLPKYFNFPKDTDSTYICQVPEDIIRILSQKKTPPLPTLQSLSGSLYLKLTCKWHRSCDAPTKHRLPILCLLP